MTLALDSAASDAVSATSRGAAWLCELVTDATVLRFTTWGADVNYAGNNYIGTGSLVEIVPFSESENTTTSKLTLRFSLVNASMLSLALVDPDVYRGKPVRLYLQLFDSDGVPAGAAIPRWFGYMDKMSVSREDGSDRGIVGKIELQCSRGGMARARNYDGLRLNSEQQKARFPGDLGLDYVPGLIEKPSVWLSREFQKQR